MESNKEEAARAAAIAEKILSRNGDTTKAIRFLKKSLAMDPSNEKTKALLQEADRMSKESTQNQQQNGTAAPGMRKRKPQSQAKPPKAKEEPPQRAYTAEQKRGVERIKRCKDLYSVLEVQRSSSQPEIKKAYRKLALKFHPDKNGAPGADEAFKEINRAFGILSDESKRRQYDQFGTTDENRGQGFRQPFYGDDFDPNDIFREVFGSNFQGGPGVRMYTFGPGFGFQARPRRGRGREQAQPQNQAPGLIQLLPLIFLFALSFMSYDRGNDTSQLFSLSQSSKYPIKQMTRTRGVVPDIPYFVSRTFSSTYRRDPRMIGSIEQQVQRDYYFRVQERCQKEKGVKKRKVSKARKKKNQDKLKEAMEQKLPYCEEISRLNSLGLVY